MVLGPNLAPGDGEAVPLEIDVLPAEGGRFRLPHSGIGQQFDEVSGGLRPGHRLPHFGNQGDELFPVGNFQDALFHLFPGKGFRRVVEDQPVPLGEGKDSLQCLPLVIVGRSGDLFATGNHPGLAIALGQVADEFPAKVQGQIPQADLATDGGSGLHADFDRLEPPVRQVIEGDVPLAGHVRHAGNPRTLLGETSGGELAVFSLERLPELPTALLDQGVVGPGGMMPVKALGDLEENGLAFSGAFWR